MNLLWILELPKYFDAKHIPKFGEGISRHRILENTNSSFLFQWSSAICLFKIPQFSIYSINFLKKCPCDVATGSNSCLFIIHFWRRKEKLPSPALDSGAHNWRKQIFFEISPVPAMALRMNLPERKREFLYWVSNSSLKPCPWTCSALGRLLVLPESRTLEGKVGGGDGHHGQHSPQTTQQCHESFGKGEE